MLAPSDALFRLIAFADIFLLFLLLVLGLTWGGKLASTEIERRRRILIAFGGAIAFGLVGLAGGGWILRSLAGWSIFVLGTMLFSTRTRNPIDAGFFAIVSGGVAAAIFALLVEVAQPWVLQNWILKDDAVVTESVSEDAEMDALALDSADDAEWLDDEGDPDMNAAMLEAETEAAQAEPYSMVTSEAEARWARVPYFESAYIETATPFTDPACPYEVTLPMGWTRLEGDFSLGLKAPNGLLLFVYAELRSERNMTHAVNWVRSLQASEPQLELVNTQTVSIGRRSWAHFELHDPADWVDVLLTHAGKRGTYAIHIRGTRQMLSASDGSVRGFLQSFNFPADNIRTADDRPGAVRVIPPDAYNQP